MTVSEFYQSIHGDYAALLEGLSSDALILHFVRRFAADNTYAELTQAVERADISASFEAAHKLKGIAANLAFSQLFAALSDLSEQLRPQTEPADAALLQRVGESYHLILRQIGSLEGGDGEQ